MSDLAISVEGLGKEYSIGQSRETYKTLRDTLSDAFIAPFRRGTKLLRGQAAAAAELDETIWALRHVTFGVKRGEVVGIIGRNGAGKTTLLRILSQITEPSEGYAEIQGRVGTLLEVGSGFHSELTGRENTYLNGAILGMKRAEIRRKFDEIVAFAEVERFIDTPVKHYSTGMHVRLAFSVAAHLESAILLVDEVLAVGDASFQKKCLGTMNNLSRGGRTVLLVSHNMAAIENFCSRAIWIDQGKIRQDGDTREVVKNYLSSFTGSSQISLDSFSTQSRRGSGEVRYTKIEFLSSDGKPLKIIRSGDSLTVRLHFHSDKRIPNPHFGIEIYTDLGVLVTAASTWAAGLDTPFLSRGDGYVDLEIDWLNLMPDRYYISLWLESMGPISYDLLDRCATFDVEVSNFYQSGRGIHKRSGVIFLPCKWRLGRLPNPAESSKTRPREQKSESRLR